INGGGKYFFLSRPRRFGKSLLVSTLKEIFSGNKELFKNLWIYDQLEWKKHPVIHIDFSGISYKTAEILEKNLANRLSEFAGNYNIELADSNSYKEKFRQLIKEMAGIEKVVILIDEYDKPIIDFIDKPEVANQTRDILKSFYWSEKKYI